MNSVSAFLFLLLTVLTACRGSEETSGSENIRPLIEPWEKAVPLQRVPDGLGTLRAADCGECHQEIYAEWKGSIHAQALADLQFQAEWKKDGHMFVCRNCHTPLQNQQKTVVAGLVAGNYHRPVEAPNPDFDPVLEEEAITCAVCHVRDGVVIGPYGDTDAPHSVRKDARLLSVQTCLNCHNVQGELSATLTCTFSTGDEWRASPYPAQGQNCITCHMPEVERPNVADSPVRASNRHTWTGGGIPKFPGEEEGARRGFVSGLDMEATPSKEFYDPGETAEIRATIRNRWAGHELPTGDVERFLTVDMQFVGPDGAILQERRERIGEVWEWWPEAKQISDNSLKPLEQRTYDLSYNIPEDLSALLFQVVVTNHRMTEENAKAMGVLGAYPLKEETLDGRLCYVVESAPKEEKGADYGRKVAWIDQETFLPIKEEYFNRKSELYRIFSADQIEEVTGFPTAIKRTMRDVKKEHRTEVTFTSVEYNLGLSEDLFSERYLRRPPAEWIR